MLGEELGIEANTVASLLVSKQKEDVEPNQIWIVDEAGLLGAENAYALLRRAKAEGVRVVLVGDTRQLSAIEAGNPFKSLQSAGINTAHLNESLRQKPPELQKAVSLTTTGQMAEAIAYLEQLHRIEEVVDVGERATCIATDYIRLFPEERQQTLIIAGTHKERKAITNEICTALKEEGTIGYSIEATQLRAKQNLTSIQTRYTHNYNIGDVVIPVRDYKKLKIYKSQQYTVVSIIGDKLVLSNLAGNHQTIDPMKFRKTLYKQENIEIAVGDRLKWTRNDKELGRRNGQEFIVIGIEGQTATIEFTNGKTDTVNLYELLHLDYALVSTTYSSQGKTADRVLVSSTVDLTVSQESVYVAISRAKYDFKIYAENIDFLLEEAQESKAQETVLELLQPKAKVQVAEKSETTIGVGKKVEKATNIAVVPDLRREETNAFASPTIVKKQLLKQLEIFWTPTSAIAPLHIEANHWQELVEGSAIHPAIASLNFRSLQMESIEQEHEAWEYLMYSDKLERTNIGQLTTGMLKRYAHIDAGGWWCDSGVNATSFSLETGKPSEKRWGCYKPNGPRSSPNKLGKKIKYEHPPKVDLGIFLLHVPDEIAQRIYEKVGVDPNSEDRMRDFWYCAWKYNLPVTITEGAKKAASLLSQGHAAIGLPGIYAGYRSKDEQGKPIKAHLHEELAVFATLGRNIKFCFDYETRPETKRNIEIAISRTGSLLQQQGARVSVVSLLGPEKGVDDLIVVHSPLAYEQAAMTALPLKQWRERNKQERYLVILPPKKKLSVQDREEKLKNSILGQQPTNQQNLDQSPDHISHGNNKQRQINQNSTDGRHNFVDSDRQLDTEYGRSESSKHQLESQRRTVESAERTSLAGEQGTEEVHSPAVERQSLGGEANAQRLHRSVQGSTGETEIGQTQRNDIRASYSHEPSLDQDGGYEPSTDASQRTSDGSLRGDYGKQEATTSDERTEIVTFINDEQPVNEQWGESLEELAQLAQSVGVEQVIKDADLACQLATLTGQINNLNLFNHHEFIGMLELAQSLTRQQSQSDLVKELAQIQVILSGLTQNVTASTIISELQPEIESLAQSVNNWQSEAEVEQAIAKVSEVIQLIEQKHSFDFGELPALLSKVNTEQLVTQTNLDLAVASLAQRLAQFTSPAPTVFNDMTALVDNVQSYQASSQLMQTRIVERVNAIAQQITELHQVGENKFDDNKSLTELALAVSSFNTQQQLLLEGGLLEQLQQSTSNTISAISRYVDQAKKDSKMLQTAKDTKTFTKPHKVIPSYNQDTLASLANQLREIPLEEIAIRLGLTLDKHDKHKWRGDGQILSINNQKFYDHLTLTGGYGAIDLVMHVQGQPFKKALKWLTDGLSELPRTYNHLTQPKAVERQPFQPPTGDNSKWLAVREYLVTKRKLPAALVDKLHSQGIIYADSKQNAVFLRQDIKSNITGASLRGTYKDSSFKGLATGSQRENGWFTFVQGEGELKRIVLVESAIDALSAAALAEQSGKAMFISTDGAGSVPVAWLLQQQGVEIVAAHDCDRAGEEMAWRLLTEISSVTRAVPTYGKDWNEQLKDIASNFDASEWRLVAQAIGKLDTYISRIMEVITSNQALSPEALAAMQQDFSTYKQLSSNLWQWHQAARSSGYSEAYLKRIVEVAIALHHPQKPIPLSESARQAMKQEIQNYTQVNRNYHRL